MLVNAMEVVDEAGASQERPIIARGVSGIRSTVMVNFHTGKAIEEEHVNKCHLNAAVFDSNWEHQAAEILDKHDKVRAWVKNDRLGLVIPYRKQGAARKYLPDFVVEMTDDSFLIVEIKGLEGDAAIKKAAAERWCKAVTNDGRFGRWAYHICWGANDIIKVLAA
jgi:type III restriction enzyme